MCARFVAAGNKRNLRCRDSFQCVRRRLYAANVGGVVRRPNDDKVVIHDIAAVHAEAGGDELVFQRPCMDQNHVDIAGFSQLQCLAGAHGNDIHLAITLLLERRQQDIENSGILCRSGGG